MPQGHAVCMKIDAALLPCLFQPVRIYIVCQVLSNQRQVRMGLQGSLQGQVAGHPAHDFADMPVFDIRAAVGTQIADGIGKGPGGGVESKRHGAQNISVVISDLDIAVDRLGHTQNLDPIGKHFLG